MPCMNASSPRASSPATLNRPRRNIDLIVLHCSATASGKQLQRGEPGKPGYLSCAQIIDAWHAERGFARKAAARSTLNPGLGSIGYHFVIDTTGQVFTGRGLDEIGAHAAGHNERSIGICLVGGVERDAIYTAAQWQSLSNVVLWLATDLQIPLALPRRTGDLVGGGVCGHRDLSPDLNGNGTAEPNEWLKTCPGFDVGYWLANRLQPAERNVVPGVRR